MIAAIYARKSTDQAVADEAKSVRRQIDHAHQYAARKGWTVSEAHVYVDDGVSGAEFANRPGFMRLMNSLKPRPAFDVLIMSEDSRLGREAIETAYALKQIIGAGVRVFFYLDDRERTLDSPTEKILMSLTAYASEMEREQARARMVDTMTRKAKAGHVCGGQCYGYDNVPVTSNGVRSHVEQRINEAEADVIRRIFELAAAGVSQVGIAKTLNTEGHPAPRSQQGRPRAWVASTVHEALHRPRYRGELVWNQTQKRDRWGQRKVTWRRPEDRIVVPASHLRIVPEGLWHAAHARIAGARERTNVWRGPERSTYLLPGNARCGLCGGGIHVRSSQRAGAERRRSYACTSHYNRGDAVCRNAVQIPMLDMDAEVLKELRNIVSPAMVDAIVAGVREAMAPGRSPRARLEAEIEALDGQVTNLTEAIAMGGNLPALVAKLATVEQARQGALRTLDALTETRPPRRDWRALERQARALLTDWRALLNRNTVEARQVLAALLPEPIVMTPIQRADRRGYRFEGRAEIGGFLAGSIEVMNVVSPVGLGQLLPAISFTGEALILPRSA